jgi:hypothetical protein
VLIDQIAKPLLVLCRPGLLGNAWIQPARPPLRTLGAIATTSDEGRHLLPVLEPVPGNTSKQALVLGVGPRARAATHRQGRLLDRLIGRGREGFLGHRENVAKANKWNVRVDSRKQNVLALLECTFSLYEFGD